MKLMRGTSRAVLVSETPETRKKRNIDPNATMVPARIHSISCPCAKDSLGTRLMAIQFAGLGAGPSGRAARLTVVMPARFAALMISASVPMETCLSALMIRL